MAIDRNEGVTCQVLIIFSRKYLKKVYLNLNVLTMIGRVVIETFEKII